jgi:hypothetical protein
VIRFLPVWMEAIRLIIGLLGINRNAYKWDGCIWQAQIISPSIKWPTRSGYPRRIGVIIAPAPMADIIPGAAP